MERDFIEWLRQRTQPTREVGLGIGDDAAILKFSGQGQVVVTTDMLMDGVDFQLDRCDPRRIGRKALAVNLSDLAAMAARPVAAFVSLALPREGGLQLAKELYEGLFAIAEEFETNIAGGDTNSWNGPLVINVAAIGSVTERGPLLRSGAKPGDWILVTGTFGGSLLSRHFDFTPRVREALHLQEHFELHAGMDVSDGLSLDLSRLAKESGCGAELELSAIPLSPDAVAIANQNRDGMSPLDHALGDGEDFELILAVAPAEARRLLDLQPLTVKMSRIGEFVATPGLWSVSESGERRPVVPRGYEHNLQ
jgi:thiamine-monophosphate kinase